MKKLNKLKDKLYGNKKLILITIVILALVFGLVLYGNYQKKVQLYSSAIESIKLSGWENAYYSLNQIRNFKDVEQILPRVEFMYKIEQGDNFLKKNQFDQAINIYKEAKDIKFDIDLAESKITNATKLKTEAVARENKIKAEAAAKKQKRIKELKNAMRTSYDKIEGITWYYDKTSPHYSNSNKIMVYMGKKNGGSRWLRFNMTYAGEDWIFFDEIIFNIDGEKIEKGFSHSDVNRETVYGGDLYETVDLQYQKDVADLINRIINSKSTLVRFSGKRIADRTVTTTQKQAMKRVIELYNLLEN